MEICYEKSIIKLIIAVVMFIIAYPFLKLWDMYNSIIDDDDPDEPYQVW